jgi:hypothetical protein
MQILKGNPMLNNFKHYFTLTLTFFMGTSERGEESHATYLRRQRDEKRSDQAAAQTTPASASPAHAQLEYMI